ncbi:unnamed protein product [Adineta ricciae]|uniref:Beta-lactamase-related domain-containing protein n=1 Tax=Adineta ricciae TaxID=249248 RepID=A0A813S0L7_ADIRI|nr:unnamed protein product [Adineta ricciae]
MLKILSLIICITTLNIINISGSNCPDRQWIIESLKKVQVPGAAVIVINATHTLYEEAFGFQSLVPPIPMNINTSIFPLASVSKTFIAAAVMQLVEKELVDLDTDVNQYLSEPGKRIFHPKYPSHSITLRKLLSHSASIFVSYAVQNTYYQPDDTAYEQRSLADVVYQYVNPNTSNWLPKPPGSVTSYSNEGSALAALVVERVSKMPYSEYVKESILKPLGVDISKTGVRLSDFATTENFVKHYNYAFNASYLEGWKHFIPQLNITPISSNFPTWLHIPDFSFNFYPSGLLRMSAKTLSTYLRMFINNGSSILLPRSIAEMRTVVGGGLIPPYSPDSTRDSTGVGGGAPPPPPQYGLSWYWNTMSDGRRYIGHTGFLPGMSHLVLVNEKHSIGVILLTNADILGPTHLAQAIGETGTDIHMALFQCFDTNATTPIVPASALRPFENELNV